MQFKLIIGCGGSGLATMIAHWQRLAYGRNRNPDSYCYLAIDSNRDALIGFKSALSRLGGGVRPFVQTIQIGRDDNRVDDNRVENLVDKYFVAPFKGGGNDVGKARLQKHWWHDENGRPYRGNPGIMGVDYNAVDCYGFTKDSECFLRNSDIKEYENSFNAGRNGDDTRRDRKLLLHKTEILKLKKKLEMEH